MTTVSDFINSDALEACVVSNCPYYREKFREIATRAGVLHAEIEDTHTGKKISRQRSWNWVAFLFAMHWAIYRRQKLLGWGLYFCYSILWIMAFSFPVIDKAWSGISIGMMVACGWWGNSSLMTKCINVYAQTTSQVDRAQKSPFSLALVIALDVVMMALAYSLFLEG